MNLIKTKNILEIEYIIKNKLEMPFIQKPVNL